MGLQHGALTYLLGGLFIGFSRKPLHWEFTTGLSGWDHTGFYLRTLLRTGKVPMVFACDMAGALVFCGCYLVYFAKVLLVHLGAWNAVGFITQTIYGNNSPITRSIGGVDIHVRPFHQTLSKKNTPVNCY
jgi:hypothetical protein